jgi:hypothetical protein
MMNAFTVYVLKAGPPRFSGTSAFIQVPSTVRLGLSASWSPQDGDAPRRLPTTVHAEQRRTACIEHPLRSYAERCALGCGAHQRL